MAFGSSLISGEPLKEPGAWYGPIVMNTQEQLQQAFEELREGNFLNHILFPSEKPRGDWASAKSGTELLSRGQIDEGVTTDYRVGAQFGSCLWAAETVCFSLRPTQFSPQC